GTEGASFPSFAPNGSAIVFVAGNRNASRLKRVPIAGGPVQNLAEALGVAGPATDEWALDDVIFYTSNGVLMRIAAAGGSPETIATPDARAGEQFFARPELLPDGRHLLVSAYVQTSDRGGLQALAIDLRTGARQTLLTRAGATQLLATAADSSGYLAYY